MGKSCKLKIYQEEPTIMFEDCGVNMVYRHIKNMESTLVFPKPNIHKIYHDLFLIQDLFTGLHLPRAMASISWIPHHPARVSAPHRAWGRPLALQEWPCLDSARSPVSTLCCWRRRSRPLCRHLHFHLVMLVRYPISENPSIFCTSPSLS